MELRALVAAALEEDIGPGDLTTDSTIAPGATGSGRILAKQDLVLCGQDVAREVFRQAGERLGGEIVYEVLVPDGASVVKGTDVARLRGSFRVLLTGERVALNFLMKLSGIATHVRPYVEAAAGQLRVVDTRKTTPLLRGLEKLAVRTGGAHNHRFALYDGVLIKDNHIAAVGGVTEAVRRARASVHHLVRIQVEVTDLDQLEAAIAAGADALLLDNMGDDLLGRSVQRARALDPRVVLEASGNMTPERIAAIRHLGLDVVSAGGLVHQARWVDLSLDVVGD